MQKIVLACLLTSCASEIVQETNNSVTTCRNALWGSEQDDYDKAREHCREFDLYPFVVGQGYSSWFCPTKTVWICRETPSIN